MSAAVRLRSALILAPWLVLEAASAPLGARSITDTWPLLAFSRDGQCELTITGNGKFMMLTARGIEPGEPARFQLANAQMKPIDWQVKANPAGSWSQVYIPMLWNNGDGTARAAQAGGTVSVRFDTARCSLAASAPWSREVRVID